MKAFDTASVLTGHAHDIKHAGYEAVCVYLRRDRTPHEEVDGLRSVGLGIVFVWEKGHPEGPAYFTAAQGKSDALQALAYARDLGVPVSVPIFFAIDYDPSEEDLGRGCFNYVDAIHTEFKTAQRLVGVYGSGLACWTMLVDGVAHFAWLAQSPGWATHKSPTRYAIVQGPSFSLLGWSCDYDTIHDQSVVWAAPAV